MGLIMKIITLVFLLCSFPALAQTEISGTCHVMDGDTIQVITDGKAINVRLGIAAPEPWQPGPKEAKAHLEKVEGKPVRCLIDGTRTHKPEVGICSVDGRDIAADVVKAGLARDCPALSGGRYQPIERPNAMKLLLPSYCEP